MPYLIIYFQEYLKIQNYALPLGIILIVSSAISVISGKPIDKIGKFHALPFAIVFEIVGLIGLFLLHNFVATVVFGILTVGGYMMVTACINGVVRDYTPKDRSGHFQGVRMIFNVLIPMIIGPYIGAAVISSNQQQYEELGQVKQVPTPTIFLASAIVIVILLVAQYFFTKKWKAGHALDINE